MSAGAFTEAVVVGCGHIGLPLAVALASRGVRVLGHDIEAGKVAALNAGRTGLMEEGLVEALETALNRGLIRFDAALKKTTDRRAFIVAVPTPADEGGFDDGPLRDVSAQIAAAAADGDLVIVRSTAPIGTARALAAAHPQLAFASAPDRSLSGRALADQFELPHVVGGVTSVAGDAAEALLSALGRTVRVSDADTAEAIKLFANTHRDLVFAEANQFAEICDVAGLDFDEVSTAGAEGYPRFALARPGPVGGPCLTKDVHVLAASPSLSGADLGLLLAARRTNERVAPRIAARLGGDVPHGGVVAILGLSFKGRPAVNDRRGAFAGSLTASLRALRPDLAVRLWNPGDGPAGPALEGADAVVLANDHPDLAAIGSSLAPGTVLYDLGRLDVRADGLTLRALGRGRS